MILHIHPGNDIFPHTLKSGECGCNPKVQLENGNMIVVHNSFDGREGVELAKEVLETIKK